MFDYNIFSPLRGEGQDEGEINLLLHLRNVSHLDFYLQFASTLFIMLHGKMHSLVNFGVIDFAGFQEILHGFVIAMAARPPSLVHLIAERRWRTWMSFYIPTF